MRRRTYIRDPCGVTSCLDQRSVWCDVSHHSPNEVVCRIRCVPDTAMWILDNALLVIDNATGHTVALVPLAVRASTIIWKLWCATSRFINGRNLGTRSCGCAG